MEGLLDEIDDFFVVLRFSLSHALPSGAIIVPILSLPMHVCRSKVNIKEMKSMPVIAASHSDSIDNNRNISEEMKNYESKMQNTMSIGQNVCASCIRESCVGDIIVYVLESPGLLGIGGKVWDSTFVLVDFLQRKGATLVAGKKIVELGSGTGITGVYVSNALFFKLTSFFSSIFPLSHFHIFFCT